MSTTPTDDGLVAWATAEHATCTRHRNYALTCDQFDALLERAAGRCELCGADSDDSAWGHLHIDHEHQVGQWAVRGLLCDSCNMKLQRGRRLPVTKALQRYLDNAWYRKELDRLGLTDEIPPEPGIGSTALAFGRSWIRLDKWETHRGVYTTTKSWQELWYSYGPMNIRVTCIRESIPSYIKQLYPYRYRSLRKGNSRTLPAKEILGERIGMALAIAKYHRWCPADREAVDRIIADLTGTPCRPNATPEGAEI